MGTSTDGEQLRARHALDERAVPAVFDTVLDQSSTGVMVFDAELRIAYVNDVAARIGGRPADDHVGRRLADLFPRTAAQVDSLVAEVFEHGAVARDEEVVWESPSPPHERRYWMATYVPVRAASDQQYVAVIYIETTPTRRAHDRLSRLIDALPTFVGMCTAEGVLLEANQATLAATALSRDELVGLPLWEASWWSEDAEVQAQLREMLATAQSGRQARADIVVHRPGRTSVTVDFQLVPIIEHGTVTALVPSGIDITARNAERDRLQSLATLSRHLNGALTAAQVARLVVAHAQGVVDADFVNVALLDDDRQGFHVVSPNMGPEIESRWGNVGLDGPRTPFHDVLATGRPVLVSREERRLRYPELVRDTDRVGLDTTAALPLVDEVGDVFGVIGVGWVAPGEFPDELRLRLDLLADLSSHALRRAQRTEARDRLVQELQDEVLAMPDASPTLDVALAYEPARGDIGLGGDWYDVVELGASCTAVVVGDVAGHGITAAARMTEAKATIRTLVLNVPHAEVIPAANRSLAHFDSGYIATAAVAWVDTGAGTLEWRLAGHVPPIVRTPDGPARLLSGAHHPPIGTPNEAQEQDPVPFPEGSLLVLYTDGLVERRNEDIGVGLERLRSIVEALPEACTAAEARDAILDGARLAEGEDDVAIVVVRNR